MKKVSFTEMKKGTKEDYLFLDEHEKKYAGQTADRILKFMSGLTETLEGYQVSRLEHSLQSATRAFKAGESEEMVVATLLHDIGDELAPMNHSEYAATILKPYVSEKTHWIIEKHGEFQAYYYAHHLGKDRDLREKYNIFCSIVVYPVIPKGLILLRLIPTATHTVEDIDETLNSFSEIREKLTGGYYRKISEKFKAD